MSIEAARRILDYWDISTGRIPRAPHARAEVEVARAYLSLLGREARMRQMLEALQDIAAVSSTRDNYGPGTRGKDELLRRLIECGEIARAAIRPSLHETEEKSND
jgi:hypothetical protein